VAAESVVPLLFMVGERERERDIYLNEMFVAMDCLFNEREVYIYIYLYDPLIERWIYSEF
jgi:hypothetical protein